MRRLEEEPKVRRGKRCIYLNFRVCGIEKFQCRNEKLYENCAGILLKGLML